MSTHLPKSRRIAHAFTLIEVMVAVAIIAIVGFVMMRFVSLNIRLIADASIVQVEENRVEGFLKWMTGQLLSMEPGFSTLNGEAHEFDGELSSDILSWTVPAGPGTLSQSGEGKYLMKLEIKKNEEQQPSLLLTREKMPDEGDRTNSTPGLPLSSAEEEREMILLPNAPGLEVRFFDARVNSWVKRWSDTNNFPSLVKIKVWLPGGTLSREAIARIPQITPNRVRPNRQVRIGGRTGTPTTDGQPRLNNDQDRSNEGKGRGRRQTQ